MSSFRAGDNERWSGVALGWVLGCGVVIRVILAPLFAGFGYDMEVLRNWAGTLADRPLPHFYETAMAPDHLPGDLWFLKLLVELFHLLGGVNLGGTPFLVALKLVPTIADLLVGFAIYVIVSGYRPGPLALRASALYILNPATVFLTSVWGQWDSVSAALLMYGFVLLRRRDWLWVAAAPLLAWAVVIKPPLAVVAILLCVLPISRFVRSEQGASQRWGTIVLQFLAAALLGLGTLLAIIVPFDVGLPGMTTRWSLFDRLSVALDLYPYTTLGAFNAWMIPIGSLERVSDLDNSLLSLSANRWGTALSVACIAYVTVQVLRRARLHAVEEVVSWGVLAVSLAVFNVPTRVHERYLFPAIVFVILYAAMHRFPRQLVWLVLALSLTFFLNLVLVYGGLGAVLPEATAEVVDAILFRAIAVVNILIFIVVLLLPRFPFAFSGAATNARSDHQDLVLR